MQIRRVRFPSVISLSAVLLLANLAKAQCPSGLASPLQLLDGTTWAFQTEDGVAGDATVGIFTAQVTPNPRSPSNLSGVLSIIETFNNSGFVGNQVAAAGSYTISSDCSAGQLNLGGSQNSYQYAFVFMPGMNKMLLVTSNPSVPNVGIGAALAGNRGRAAMLLGVPSCNGAIPPALLAGTWSFLVQDYASAAVGLLNAQFGSTTRAPGAVTGLLNGTETTSGGGFLQLQASVTGSYQMYSDCSGGQMTFNSGAASSYAFVFAGLNEIYMVSIAGDQNGTGGFYRANYGQAYRQ